MIHDSPGGTSISDSAFCQITLVLVLLYAVQQNNSFPRYSVIVFVFVCLCLIDNISSKIVPLEKGVVTYGANALSILPVVLFVLPINVHVTFFLLFILSLLYAYDMVQCNKPACFIH